MAIINGVGRVGIRNYVSPTSATNPLWNSLVAYYTGDNTSNDAKGTYNGTLVNGATYGTGKISNGFSLDGINDYVNMGDVMDIGLNSFTFNAWINPSNVSSVMTIISKSYAGPGSGRYSFYLYGNKLAMFFATAWGSGADDVTILGNTSLSSNTWYMCTFVIDRVNGMSIYINGNSESCTSTGSRPNSSLYLFSAIDYNSSETFKVGAYTDSMSFFSGKIDEIGVWNRVLTPAEVTELYNAGAGKQYVAPAPAYTSRTTAFAAATGITDATILNALNTFDTGLISNGLASKMKALYPMVGGTSTTHKFNFMDARDVDAAFRLVFNGGWVHSSTGAQPNGTNGYANTYFNHVNNGNDKNNFGLTIYSRTNSTGYKVDIGAVDSDSYSWIAPRYNSTIDFVGIYDNSWFYGNYVTSSLGLFTSLRNSLTSQKFFQNGILKGQRTGFNTQANINLNIYISCRNLYSVASNFSDRQLAFSGIHDSLTDAEALTFYNLVQAMQTSLSRAV